jgi:hypothetical protein
VCTFAEYWWQSAADVLDLAFLASRSFTGCKKSMVNQSRPAEVCPCDNGGPTVMSLTFAVEKKIFAEWA